MILNTNFVSEFFPLQGSGQVLFASCSQQITDMLKNKPTTCLGSRGGREKRCLRSSVKLLLLQLVMSQSLVVPSEMVNLDS